MIENCFRAIVVRTIVARTDTARTNVKRSKAARTNEYITSILKNKSS
jgi:hypothetical protein